MAEQIVTISELKKYDTKKGTAVTEVEALPSTVENRTYVVGEKVYVKSIPIATLDANGHIPVEQMPTEALIYKGQWDASTGAYPVQTSYTVGDFYIVSVAGTVGEVNFLVGDWIIWNGSSWDKSANTNAVTKVNGQTGDVCITEVEKADSLASDYVVPYTNGGTGLSTLGTSGQVLTATETGIAWGTPTITKMTSPDGTKTIEVTNTGIVTNTCVCTYNVVSSGDLWLRANPDDIDCCVVLVSGNAIEMCGWVDACNGITVEGGNLIVDSDYKMCGNLCGTVNGITFSIV